MYVATWKKLSAYISVAVFSATQSSHCRCTWLWESWSYLTTTEFFGINYYATVFMHGHCTGIVTTLQYRYNYSYMQVKRIWIYKMVDQWGILLSLTAESRASCINFCMFTKHTLIKLCPEFHKLMLYCSYIHYGILLKYSYDACMCILVHKTKELVREYIILILKFLAS